jgi:hypothetical protein
MKPFLKWITLDQLLNRWETTVVENIFEAARGGLQIYEETEEVFLTGMVELAVSEAAERYYFWLKNCNTPEYIRPLPQDCICFMLEDVKKYEQLYGGNKQAPAKQAPKTLAKSRMIAGRKPGYLREAVEFLYHQCLKRGELTAISPQKIDGFIKLLKDSINEGNRNFSEYIAERIKNVRKSGGEWRIVTQEKIKHRENYEQSKIYKQIDVSKILVELRKKNPIPE